MHSTERKKQDQSNVDNNINDFPVIDYECAWWVGLEAPIRARGFRQKLSRKRQREKFFNTGLIPEENWCDQCVRIFKRTILWIYVDPLEHHDNVVTHGNMAKMSLSSIYIHQSGKIN